MMRKILITLATLVGLNCMAADMRISDYPNTNYVGSANLFLLAIPGVTNKNITYSQLLTHIQNTIALDAAAVASGTLADARISGNIARLTDITSQIILALNFSNASAIANGIVTSNAYSIFDQRTVENRDTIFRRPWMGIDLYGFAGFAQNEAMVLNAAKTFYTNNMTASWDRPIIIVTGWNPGYDGSGNPLVDGTKFPHGMQNLATWVHTNNCRLFLYTEFNNIVDAGNGRAGCLTNMQQYATTFQSWGIDGVRCDYPELPIGVAGHNARLGYYAATFANILEQTYGYPVPLYDSGWHFLGGQLNIAPGTCNSWTIGDIGDELTSGPADPGFFWTNMLSLFYYRVQGGMPLQSGPSHWHLIDFVNPLLGYGFPSMMAVEASPIINQRAYGPGDGSLFGFPAPFTINTNQGWISVVRDPAPAGRMIYSNNVAGLFVRKLEDQNAIAVCMINNQSNVVSSPVGFDGGTIGLAAGASFIATDVWYQTNNLASSSYYVTSSIPANSAMLYIVKPYNIVNDVGIERIVIPSIDTFHPPLKILNGGNPAQSMRFGPSASHSDWTGISLYDSTQMDWQNMALFGSSNTTRLYVSDSTNGNIVFGSPTILFAQLYQQGLFGAMELGGLPMGETNTLQIDTPQKVNALGINTNGDTYINGALFPSVLVAQNNNGIPMQDRDRDPLGYFSSFNGFGVFELGLGLGSLYSSNAVQIDTETIPNAFNITRAGNTYIHGALAADTLNLVSLTATTANLTRLNITNVDGQFGDTNLANSGYADTVLSWVGQTNDMAWLLKNDYSTNPVTTGNGTATMNMGKTYQMLQTNVNITVSLSGISVTNDRPSVMIISNTLASGSTIVLTASGFSFLTNGVPTQTAYLTNLSAKRQVAYLSVNSYAGILTNAVLTHFYEP